VREVTKEAEVSILGSHHPQSDTCARTALNKQRCGREQPAAHLPQLPFLFRLAGCGGSLDLSVDGVKLFLELDEHLSTGGTVPSHNVTTYELGLRKGEATKTILFELAGEHSLRLTKPSNEHLDVTSMARIKVIARKASKIDVCNIPEAGRAGLEFELVVLARDRYGNVDHTHEQDVSLNHDGHLPPGHTLDIDNGGIVKLRNGRGRVRATHRLPPQT